MQRKGILMWDDGTFTSFSMAIEASGPVSRVMKFLDDCGKVPVTILPHEEFSCAAFAKYEDRKFFLMYHPPKRRPLIWKNKFTGERRTFVVLWPHIYIGVFFRGGGVENGYAMVAREKIKTKKSLLGRLPLPNTSGMYGHICEGVKGMWRITDAPSETAVSYAKYFFDSEYVSDINDHYPFLPKEFRPPSLANLSLKYKDDVAENFNQEICGIWQGLSESNPDVVSRIEWNVGFTLIDLVSENWRSADGVDPSILGNLFNG